MGGNLLIIFVKAPRRGAVKTRIAEAIGAQAACDAYLGLVEVLIGNLRTLSNVQVRYTPDDALLEIPNWLQPMWTSAPQGQGDLGQRLTRAFKDAFSTGSERVVIIGSDCPEVNEQDVQSAWAALENHDLVLGPAEDGGYWLIGLHAQRPALFENISWSSSAVFEQTIARANAANLSIHLLRKLNDIDTIDDLRSFEARFAPR